ncbi:hypothetical protein AB0M20_32645 [Actinoplanes sp. NPDC051633]|uniref:hypothetical protein n=1 Tax=Actinoplanes sp. NPDC051633 TaxID=3155670 RepID=UPI00342DA611
MVQVERVEIDTTDFALAHEYLSRAHVDHEVRLRPPDEDFVFRAKGAAAGELSLERSTYRAAAAATAEPMGALRAGVRKRAFYP